MGKSIRSKIKRKFRTIKRVNVDPFVTEKLKEIQEESPLTVRAEETPESAARRNDPRKKDTRLGCAAFALAFPGGKTNDHLRRGGVGNPLSCPPIEKEMERAAQRAAWAEEDRVKEEQEKAGRMDVEVKPKKKIQKKKKSLTSFKRSNI
mmetsp:Transcript_27693/g.68468  ORF Transcript_27693/g.68468 Transcript_27693/m.68468 type:complete len:149 (+) Transcript_27693:132-578(+)|eukprot:CAMPEP_0206256580 /NCGR_PEP_ID=MMETSP0047_2-20121206/24856_1 /ASSEMBLY_ACC=CAM_ASM_000192 /TAXON_ID=195065 /ORGANISM="Chroomonas mesostigmatica_cf, Strain CCMP1168" /LENGTH=148 /DNA_ID=CAMNT_0053683055 /DNA_START=132 /DNA_END=578 /DNA_ORIENTATION=-